MVSISESHRQNKEKRLKILSTTTSYPCVVNPSSGVFIYNLNQAMAERADVEVVAPSCLGITTRLEDKCRVLYFRYAPSKSEIIANMPGGLPSAMNGGGIKKLALILAFVLSYFASIMKHGFKVDVVHTNWAVSGLLALPLRLFGVKIITTFRGEDVTRAKTSRIWKEIVRAVLIGGNHCVAVSADMSEWIRDTYSTDKITHINNGISERFFTLYQDRDYSDKNQVSFICVGSLIERKNIGFLIKALSYIGNQFDWKLNVIGDGPLCKDLMSLCESLGLKDRVDFLGNLKHEDVLEYYAIADVFLFSSISEGKPNVLFEAMASGVPVIAPNISGVSELIDHEAQGMIYELNDQQDFLDKLALILKDSSLRETLAESAHEKVKNENGSWQDAAEKYIELFDQSLGR